MITLALLRHAKAVKDDPGGDHARRLSESGRTDAVAAGQWLRGALTGDILVLASDARRTRETAELAFPPPRVSVELRLEAELYGASAMDLLGRLHRLGESSTVVLVGHNPGIGETARQLIGTGDADTVARLKTGFPTATAAILEFPGAWRDIRPGDGRLKGLFLRNNDA